MIKAILFDMDGVLYDSMPSHAQAWFDTMSEYITGPTLEDFYMFEGRTGFSTINILFNRFLDRDATEEEIETIYTKKSNRFNELEKGSSKIMPGALEVLEKVKSLGLSRIIVTGSGQKSLFEKIDTNFPGYFNRDLMVTAYDVRFGKPHPEPYLMGLKKGSLQAHEAIVVENAPLGVEAARAADIHTIAVNTGPLSDQVLLDAGANKLFNSMNDLAANVEDIIRSMA
ncbi:HAD-IA family hydrolase [Bacteroidales bacterium OttesenSCG-928-I14]|nr:HAD-IA family hydrolase [Bacteroidales bacterium OttesenSCG-928-I14]